MHAALRARARYSVPRIRCRGRKCEAIMTRGRWTGGVPSPRPFETHKAAVGIACQAFIDQVLKPRLLAEVRPTEFNYRSISAGGGTAPTIDSSSATVLAL